MKMNESAVYDGFVTASLSETMEVSGGQIAKVAKLIEMFQNLYEFISGAVEFCGGFGSGFSRGSNSSR